MGAVARGDERALGVLVERHAAGLHAHLVRACGSRDDADDLLQETWVRVARSARTYRTGRPVRPWLHGIAANPANDLWRRRTVHRRLARAAPSEPPARDLEASEGLALRERVTRLPERLREVLWLRFYAGLDEAEMAEALVIPRGTVKSRLHGAIRALREGWEDAR